MPSKYRDIIEDWMNKMNTKDSLSDFSIYIALDQLSDFSDQDKFMLLKYLQFIMDYDREKKNDQRVDDFFDNLTVEIK